MKKQLTAVTLFALVFSAAALADTAGSTSTTTPAAVSKAVQREDHQTPATEAAAKSEAATQDAVKTDVANSGEPAGVTSEKKAVKTAVGAGKKAKHEVTKQPVSSDAKAGDEAGKVEASAGNAEQTVLQTAETEQAGAQHPH